MSERLFLRLDEDAVHGPEAIVAPGTLRAFPVEGALRDHVAQILFCREELPPGQEVLERVLPDGAVRLVFELGRARAAREASVCRAKVIGASAGAVLVRLSGVLDGVSVTLRPGAAAALLGVPAEALSRSEVPLEDVWKEDALESTERLLEAGNDTERARIVQELLRRRLARSHPSGASDALRAARLIQARGGQGRVADLAEAMGIGERRLQQLFQAHVGLSPRTWSRLARLHACLRALRASGTPRWADLAVSTGFFDQAHLANEFRALSGLTPSEFLGARVSGSSKTTP